MTYLSTPEAEFPELPLKITVIPEDDLMELYERFRRWLDYYDAQLVGKQRTEELEAVRRDKELNLALIENRSQKNVTLVKAGAEVAPDYLNAEYKYLDAKNARREAEKDYRRSERAYWHCKTEIDRRKRPGKSEKIGWGHLD